MESIALVTDSAADLPRELIEEYQISVVPLNIHFGEETYQDGVNISGEEFYLKLKNSSQLPKTSQPAPGEFLRIYQELLAQKKQIISLHLSSTLSGTVQGAQLAREMLPQADIEVLDSFSGSMGTGLMVLEAARLVREGKNKEEIIAKIVKLKSALRLIGVVDTLEYLYKGGRIGRAKALLGFLLNVKPLLVFRNGELDSLGKARGRDKAWKMLLEWMKEEVGADDILQAAIMHGNSLAEAKKVEEMLKRNFNCREIILTCMGSTIGTHLGPGMVALAYYKIEE